MTNSIKKLSPKSLEIFNLVNIYLTPYVWMTESLCCTAEIKHSIVNQLYFNNLKKKMGESQHL